MMVSNSVVGRISFDRFVAISNTTEEQRLEDLFDISDAR